MPQPKKAARFGNSASHHNMMMANLTTELIRHGRITTTLAKAKTVQPLAERMITFGKRGDLHARRQVLRVIRDKDVVRKLFDDVGPAFAERNGGYTRVLKLGARKGDAAPMALIEFTEGVGAQREGDLAEEPRRRWGLRRRRGADTAAEVLAAPATAEPAEAETSAGDRAPATGTEGAAPGGPGGADTTSSGPAAPREPAAEDLVEADPAEVEARLGAEDDASATADEAAEAGQPDADEAATGPVDEDDTR